MEKLFPCTRKIRSVLVFCLAALILTACAARKDFQSLMKKVSSDDNSFAAGYLDGCDSGLSTDPEFAGRIYFQDILRYTKDESYAAGWESGYEGCSR